MLWSVLDMQSKAFQYEYERQDSDGSKLEQYNSKDF